jgi:hypothetical protein
MVIGQRHAPADLSAGKTWYPLYRSLSVNQDISVTYFLILFSLTFIIINSLFSNNNGSNYLGLTTY